MKTLTQAAQAAKLIRAELKKAFTGIKFKVRSSTYSMGDSVYISWEDGPTDEEVSSITSKYQYGSFNGMEDLYEYSNKQDFPQTKYVQVQRNYSLDLKNKVFEFCKGYVYGMEDCKSFDDYVPSIGRYVEYVIYRILSRLDISNGFTDEDMKKAWLA